MTHAHDTSMTHKKISKKATFQWKMADGWCAEYKELDGKVSKMTDAQVGVNFPPMYPWCRYVTIANIDDDTLKTLDRRAGKEKVPADMTYKEWEDKFVVDDESKRDYIVKAYTPEQNIIKERMQVNKIIVTMPKKCRMHYRQPL